MAAMGFQAAAQFFYQPSTLPIGLERIFTEIYAHISMGNQLTVLLQRLETGDREAIDAVIPLVYDELKKLARSHLRREAGAVPLETTALVHEAFLKLASGRHPSYENRAHFYGIASRLMRQVLVDAARARAAEKRSA